MMLERQAVDGDGGDQEESGLLSAEPAAPVSPIGRRSKKISRKFKLERDQ
jgi:hypothetical protein